MSGNVYVIIPSYRPLEASDKLVVSDVDFLHNLLLTMTKVKAKYQAIGKELTEAGLIRVALVVTIISLQRGRDKSDGIDASRPHPTSSIKGERIDLNNYA